MDFAQYTKIAEDWVGSQSIPVELFFADEEEGLLVFKVGDDSCSVPFNVGCPRNKRTRFTVWSDNEQVALRLSQIQDFLESCREKTLNDVLEAAFKMIKPVIPSTTAGAAASGDSEDEAFEDNDDMEDDDDDDGYYEEQELFTDEQAEVVRQPASDRQSPGQYNDPLDLEINNQFGKCRGSAVSVHRLLADLKQIRKCGDQFGFEASPRGDNLFLWDVKLIDFDKNSRLGEDLARYSNKYNEKPIVYLEVSFPETYPMAPPFLRVVKPRFKFLTGHITIGGSICMELLTTSGWRPTNDVEVSMGACDEIVTKQSVLVQVRSAITSDHNAQLDDINMNKAYTESEAKRAFSRMVQRYGWE